MFDGTEVKICSVGKISIQKVYITQSASASMQINREFDFMGPEYFNGEAVDFKADVYSAGVLLYFLFTAKFPIDGGNNYLL